MGEAVNITIKIIGTDPLTFPNSILGTRLKVRLLMKSILVCSTSNNCVRFMGSKICQVESKKPLWITGRRRKHAASTPTGSLPTNMTFSCKNNCLVYIKE